MCTFKFKQQQSDLYLIPHNNSMASTLRNPTTIIPLSIILRIVLIIYLSQFESISSQQLSATDIDYKVYTDAAYQQSPYHRHTYRYTPILAYMMAFNHVLQYAGKLLFVFFDLLAMLALAGLTRKHYRNTIVMLYGLNPIFIYLTVRGSCQSISLALMFWCFGLIFSNNGSIIFDDILNKKVTITDNRKFAWLGYVLYGIWVHFRVYPIIFLPLLLVHEYKLCERTKQKFIIKFITISVLSGGTFLGLLAMFYLKYGQQFLEQTYLYHLTRLDNRHSFSPIFYDIYLSLNSQSFLRSMAQICVIVAVTKRLHVSISPYYAHFLITYAFVSFNKVITMQYYMWIFGALLLVLPQSTLINDTPRRYQKTFSYVMQYSLGILLWVWSSIKLEKHGENQFNLMWFICIGKLFSDWWAVSGFMTTIRNKQLYQALPQQDKDNVANKPVTSSTKLKK